MNDSRRYALNVLDRLTKSEGIIRTTVLLFSVPDLRDHLESSQFECGWILRHLCSGHRKLFGRFHLGLNNTSPLLSNCFCLLVAVTSLASRLPDSMMNIPNREYWLHSDRRSATLAWMNRMLAWIAVLTSLFMIGIGHLAFLANKTDGGLHVGFFGAALGVYLIYVFSVAGRSLFRFRLPRPTV